MESSFVLYIKMTEYSAFSAGNLAKAQAYDEVEQVRMNDCKNHLVKQAQSSSTGANLDIFRSFSPYL